MSLLFLTLVLFSVLLIIVYMYYKYLKLYDIDPRGRLIVVTGAAGGIGQQTVRDLVAMGCEVIACDINMDKLRQLFDTDDKASANKVHCVRVDVTSLSDIEQLAKYVKENFYDSRGQRLYGLVNNAGIAPTRISALVDKGEEETMHMLNINLLAAHRITRALYPFLLRLDESVHNTDKKRNEFIGACVVNISSVLSATFPGFSGLYPTTKAAIACYSDSLRREFRYKKIRVSCIHPGAIQTTIWRLPQVAGPEETEFSDGVKLISEAQLTIDRLQKQPPSVVSQCITKCLFSYKNSGWDGVEHMIAERNWIKYLGYKFLPMLPSWLNDWYFRQFGRIWFVLG
jgi:NAD(P)-dependent dehydrogenase (short-subunit alcohol dehydrogenase family)